MNLDTSNLMTILIQGGAFVAAFAAITAAVLMFSVTKKFGTGILAAGFKSIAVGVGIIALGIIVDAVGSYLQTSLAIILPPLLIVKAVFFVVGTYIIVIGSKKTGDKLESLTK
jgi:uncharacterized membrane-anchored protein